MGCRFKYAQGCHLSTSEDLLKLGNVFINPTVLFKNSTPIKIATKKQISFSSKQINYGIGVIIDNDFYGNYYWGHDGMENGSTSGLRIYPNQNLVISILANSHDYNLEELISEVIFNYIEQKKNEN